MERAFLEPVTKASGEVRFPAGVLYDWSPGTWNQIATNLGKSLNEITISKEHLAARGVSDSKAKGSGKPSLDGARHGARPRLKE